MAEASAVVALGANLPSFAGGPLRSLRFAIERLNGLSVGDLQYSSPYGSAAVDCESGAPDFVNAVAIFTPLPVYQPGSLLRELQAIEQEFGRRRYESGIRSRTLDLDLVCLGDLVLDGPELVIPHPQAVERSFVLAPLAELVPELVLPGTAVSVRELLSGLPRSDYELVRLSWDES